MTEPAPASVLAFRFLSALLIVTALYFVALGFFLGTVR